LLHFLFFCKYLLLKLTCALCSAPSLPPFLLRHSTLIIFSYIIYNFLHSIQTKTPALALTASLLRFQTVSSAFVDAIVESNAKETWHAGDATLHQPKVARIILRLGQ
jgi:hypothetical protein